MKMNDLSLNFEEISRKFPKLSDLNFDYGSIINNIDIQPTKVKIDEKSTFAYQMQQQTNQSSLLSAPSAWPSLVFFGLP